MAQAVAARGPLTFLLQSSSGQYVVLALGVYALFPDQVKQALAPLLGDQYMKYLADTGKQLQQQQQSQMHPSIIIQTPPSTIIHNHGNSTSKSLIQVMIYSIAGVGACWMGYMVCSQLLPDAVSEFMPVTKRLFKTTSEALGDSIVQVKQALQEQLHQLMSLQNRLSVQQEATQKSVDDVKRELGKARNDLSLLQRSMDKRLQGYTLNGIHRTPSNGPQTGKEATPRNRPSGRGASSVGGNTSVFLVTVPENVQPGEEFHAYAGGDQIVRVRCPLDTRPGQSLQINVSVNPTPVGTLPDSSNVRRIEGSNPPACMVSVPEGVEPGAQCPVQIQGQQLMVTCPPNGMAGWTRTVRATDLKFQWVRMDDNGDVDVNTRFHMENSAYVRKLEFRQGSDPRLRTGVLSLVPATESVVDSKIKSFDGRDVVNYSDIAEAQVKNFDDKVQWFHDTCARLSVEWNEGHMRMNVRREYLLGDSVDAVMSLSRKDLRKQWRFEFIGEMGIDAGGLAREWFQLVCQQIFDPDMGLWMSSSSNQMSMTINPASGKLASRMLGDAIVAIVSHMISSIENYRILL
jgi:hypothetical protein